MPAPARCVSIACSRGESSLPIAAAMPPCAQSVAAPLPSRVLQRTVTFAGCSLSAAIKPAMPAPTTSASLRCVSLESRSIARLAAELEHSFDRAARALRDLRRDGDLVLHRFEGVQYLRKRVALHVRAEIARAHELDARIAPGNVVGHRALGHQQHARLPASRLAATSVPTYSVMPCVEPT